jgi:hypothetical protein
MFIHRYIISYLGVIGGVQNFTPVLKFIHQGAHPWLHQNNEFISYEAVYAKKKNQTKNKQKDQKNQRIEKIAILFSILHILHILLFIIIKLYVNVSFHIIYYCCA